MGGGGKLAASLLAVVASVAIADDPYADYVKMVSPGDAYNRSSWNVAGQWGDGQIPDSTKKYYVPRAFYFMRLSNPIENDVWNGGQLVIDGKFRVYVSMGDKYSPLVRDLVLLGGSELQVDCYGPLKPVNSEVGVVTVRGTHANPSRMTQHYTSSFPTGSASPRSHSMQAKLTGTADSCLVFTRPVINYAGKATDRGFYMTCGNSYYGEYPGTFVVRGTNTIVRPAANETYNWPNAEIQVDQRGECYFYYNNNYIDAVKNAYLRSLDLRDACIRINYHTAGAVAYPLLNVTEKFSIAPDGEVLVNAAQSALIAGLSASNPYGHSVRIAHLTGTAAQTAGNFDGVRVLDYLGVGGEFAGMRLHKVDNGDGSADVYVATPNIVTMTNDNVETSGYPAGSTQYGAFEPGHATDWSNGEEPAADSAYHYLNIKRLCFFQSVSFPNAKLTIAYNSSWKAGESIEFKEISICPGVSFGLWSSDATRYMNAERLNIVRNVINPAASMIYSGQSHVLTINADVCGDGNLHLRNINDQYGTISMPHVNTNFHGRLLLSQVAVNAGDPISPYRLKTYIWDARNLGGAYTTSNDTYCAITLKNNPSIVVTNNVTFSEPTRGMLIEAGGQFNIGNGKTMRMENQITFAGALDKTGLGTLDLAGAARFIDGATSTAPSAGTNVLTVSQGALRISSAEAADGLAISFAEGTRLVIPAASEKGYCNTKWNAPLTINTNDGTLPVVIDVTGVDASNIEVPICTFNATAAENIPETAFAVQRISSAIRCKGVEKRTNADGSVSYVARIGVIGTQFFFR